jgi:RNA polymerase sigma-70 factor (ECF subfamily)
MTRCVQLIEEIVNDTMLVVWQKAHRFDGTSKVSTWIFAIAYRKACKAIKGLDEPVDIDLDLFEGAAGCEPEHELTCSNCGARSASRSTTCRRRSAP